MKIFYHNDNDGKAAAAMVYLYVKKLYSKKLEEKDFIEVNYVENIPDDNLVDDNEEVYILDYSFTDITIDILRRLNKKTKNIIWLDHHKTSLDIVSKVKEEKLVSFMDIDINRSGALIAYDNLIRYTKASNVFIDRIIKLVDDYDRWVHNYSDSILFNIGSTMFNSHPMSDIWYNDPSNIINIGKNLKDFKDNMNRNFCKLYSYECIINGYKCIVLNTPESSSQAFVEKYSEYNFAIRYVFDGEFYKYSIYSNLKDIDCSKIAKIINSSGGGHKGAAGCISDKIEFLPNKEYTF